MMNRTERREKQSLSLHQKIRHAGFVQTEGTHKYKYDWIYKLYHVCSSLRIATKSWAGIIRSKLDLLQESIDWSRVRHDSSIWFVEVLLEGVTANFTTHILLGVNFTCTSIIAHGILIKQGIDIYWRLRINGATTKIPHKRN